MEVERAAGALTTFSNASGLFDTFGEFCEVGELHLNSSSTMRRRTRTWAGVRFVSATRYYGHRRMRAIAVFTRAILGTDREFAGNRPRTRLFGFSLRPLSGGTRMNINQLPREQCG